MTTVFRNQFILVMHVKHCNIIKLCHADLFSASLPRVIKSTTATQIYQGKNIGEKLKGVREQFPSLPCNMYF